LWLSLYAEHKSTKGVRLASMLCVLLRLLRMHMCVHVHGIGVTSHSESLSSNEEQTQNNQTRSARHNKHERRYNAGYCIYLLATIKGGPEEQSS
jgi:hypothetical protein